MLFYRTAYLVKYSIERNKLSSFSSVSEGDILKHWPHLKFEENTYTFLTSETIPLEHKVRESGSRQDIRDPEISQHFGEKNSEMRNSEKCEQFDEILYQYADNVGL